MISVGYLILYILTYTQTQNCRWWWEVFVCSDKFHIVFISICMKCVIFKSYFEDMFTYLLIKNHFILQLQYKITVQAL